MIMVKEGVGLFPIVAILILTAGCNGIDGNYLGGLIQVTDTASEDNESMEAKEEDLADNKRNSHWGECDHWQFFTFVSKNDVDTSWIKLMRHQIVDVDKVPQAPDAAINQQIQENWTDLLVERAFRYVMQPRWAVVKSGDFEQKGLVAYHITRDNQNSTIDVAYCVGGDQQLGFYIPHTIADRFESDLKLKFDTALQ